MEQEIWLLKHNTNAQWRTCPFTVDVQCRVKVAPFRTLQASDCTYKYQPKLILSH